MRIPGQDFLEGGGLPRREQGKGSFGQDLFSFLSVPFVANATDPARLRHARFGVDAAKDFPSVVEP
jgi:hypothetical protein